MKPQNESFNSMTRTQCAEFTLASGATLELFMDWSNNEGEKWTFDVGANLLNSNEHSFTTSRFHNDTMDDIASYFDVKATAAELDIMRQYVLSYKEKLSPSGSPRESYYGH